MADPLSTVAAVVGVADVGFKLSRALARYAIATATPSKAIKAIHPEVTFLALILQQLGNGLADDDNLRLCNQATIVGAYELAVSCGAALQAIQDIIEKYFLKENIVIIDRLRRYQKEKEVNLLGATLERLKSSITLMLEVIQYARSVAEHRPIDKASEQKYLVALAKKEKDDEAAVIRLRAKTPTNMTEGLVSKFDSSSMSSEKSHSYAVVDRSGAFIAGEAERISDLIDEIEEIQRNVGAALDPSAIWEKSHGGTGLPHYRKTIISTPAAMETTRGMGGLPDSMTRMSPMIPMSPIGNQMVDLYIALMGAVGSGKSSFVNLCCDGDLAQVSRGAEHCTASIGEYHFMYTPEIRIHLIDTPGFNDGHRIEREILSDLAEWMSQSHGPNARLSGIIYFHRISDPGMKVSAHRNLKMFEKLCGTDAFHSIVLATTNWDVFGDPDANVVHEQELRDRDDYWGLMTRRGSAVVRHTGDKDSAMRVLGALGPLHHAKPVADPYNQQMEPMDRKRGFSDAGLAFQSQSNEATIHQLLAQYTNVVDTPQTARRWSVDPKF